MTKLFLVNERFGRYSGAEQHIYVTLPFISQNFDVQFISVVKLPRLFFYFIN